MLDKVGGIRRKLLSLKSRGKLKPLLEKLEVKWWRFDTETLDEKSARFDEGYQRLIEAVENIASCH